MRRIQSHPIINDPRTASIPFTWLGETMFAKEGEMLSSALMANGVSIFGHHFKDESPQGIFCANGQCSQCMVVADGLPVKSCMTAVRADMQVLPMDGLPQLPPIAPGTQFETRETPRLDTEVLIIGAGPAGLSAAIELGSRGIQVLLIDDKDRLGGKLVLQTHRFFGSSDAVYAGTRGVDIAKKLEDQLAALPSVSVWTRSTALAIFEEKTVAVYRDGETYTLVKPQVLLVAAGAREKNLAFPGNTLPGIYGAGAFQTLVNRDLVRPCENLFIVGGGNVGLIAGYHAIQAGIHVAGLVEAAQQCGGYKVHLDKLVRSGVPVYTRHTILKAEGDESVERIIVAQVDDRFRPIPGTEKVIPCDTVLIAVGLDPVNEFITKAQEVGMRVYSAGDAQEIAEASAAIFSGKIAGNEIAQELGRLSEPIPQEWVAFEEVLKSKPGKQRSGELPTQFQGVYPVMHCNQEIPCDPCSTVCPKNLIYIDPKDIRNMPEFVPGDKASCIACARCVAVCPGLAISLVDFRKNNEFAIVSLPYEQDAQHLALGQLIAVTDIDGNALADLPIQAIKKLPAYRGTTIVSVEAPREMAAQIAGFRIIENLSLEAFEGTEDQPENLDDEAYICRCERVKAKDIKALIRLGVRDINQIKAETKLSMGACGGKTCLAMIRRVFAAEGVPFSEVTETRVRPVFIEMPVAALANIDQESKGGAL